MSLRRCWTAVAIASAAVGLPGAAAAQSCGLVAGTGVGASAGVVSYDLVDGVTGASFGIDGGFVLPAVSILGAYRVAALDGRTSHTARGAAGLPLPLPVRLGGLRLCAIGHAGAARLPVDEEGMTVVAGGLGLRVATSIPFGAGIVVPYGEARGLAAHSTGTLLGVDAGASGLSLGAEGGIQAAVGSVTLRLSGSMDRFADGLGVTPYPHTRLELGVGLRF